MRGRGTKDDLCNNIPENRSGDKEWGMISNWFYGIKKEEKITGEWLDTIGTKRFSFDEIEKLQENLWWTFT